MVSLTGINCILFYNNNCARDRMNILINYFFSVSECKKTWTSLRDNFRKALKGRKTSSGQANSSKKKWKYEDVMSFMIPFYKERRQKSSIQNTDIQLENNNDMSLSGDESNLQDLTEEPVHPRSVSPEHPRSVSPGSSHYSTSSTTTKIKKQQTSQVAEVLQNYFHQKQSLKVERKADPLQKYFAAVEETVRTFPPALQIEIKQKISSLLSDYELKNLNLMEAQQNPTQLPQNLMAHQQNEIQLPQNLMARHETQSPSQIDQYLPQFTQKTPAQVFQSRQNEMNDNDYDNSSYIYHNLK